MRELKDINSIDEIVVVTRGLSILKLEGELNMSFRSPSFSNFYHLWKFKRRRKLIHRICELGGIITGSRVLNNSYTNGILTLDRNVDNSDWDILVTEENLYKITSEIDFIEHDGKLKYRIISSDEYGYGSCDIDLIVIESLPEIHKVNEYLFADPIYIIERKLRDIKKNEGDLKFFFWKFRNLIK